MSNTLTKFLLIRWKKYFPFHLKMLSDVEDLAMQQHCDQGPSLTYPTRGWLRRKIRKIARVQKAELSQTATRKAMAELQRTILTITENENDICCQQVHRSLSTAFVTAMSAKAQSTVAKIKSNQFHPQKLSSPRGIHRLFAPIPQFSFSTRYLPIDTTVLRQLLHLVWRDDGHPEQQMLQEAADEWKENGFPVTVRQLIDQEFDACRSEWWSRLFNLYSLKGVRVHGIKPPGVRHTNRLFDFFVSTDGVGCSVVCSRPRSPPPRPSYAAETVPLDRKTVFKAIDPGLTDIWAGVIPSLTFVENEENMDQRK